MKLKRGESKDVGLRHWLVVTKFDPRCCELADGHYSRRTPGAPQFMPPGQTIALRSRDGLSVFGWWRPDPKAGLPSMNGLDGWTCCIFRRTGGAVASELILDAEQAIGALGYGCGPSGLLTYVWDRKVASPNPGYCFKRAGYRRPPAGWPQRSADGRKSLLWKPYEAAARPESEARGLAASGAEGAGLETSARDQAAQLVFANEAFHKPLTTL